MIAKGAPEDIQSTPVSSTSNEVHGAGCEGSDAGDDGRKGQNCYLQSEELSC
jgi:hypothetical protein